MKFLKPLILPIYYLCTLPCRQWLRGRLAERGQGPISVLLYHRLTRDCDAPWCTTLEAFRRHIAWLQRHCDILSLANVQQCLCHGRWRTRPAVAITFDDGYADNLRGIADLLAAGIPFTYFVTVENIRTGQPFQHDLERGYRFRPNTPQEIRGLAEAGVEIGSHGWTHVSYDRLAPEQLHRELQTSKKWLEDLIGRPITAFAVPFGRREHVSPWVVAAARRAGYRIVCSAFGGYNIPFRQRAHIQRIHGDNSFWRLVNRVTVDPRLLRRTIMSMYPVEIELEQKEIASSQVTSEKITLPENKPPIVFPQALFNEPSGAFLLPGEFH